MPAVEDAAVNSNTAFSSTAAKRLALGSSNLTVSDNTKPESTLQDISAAPHPKTTVNLENDMKVLCSVTMQQKVASCEY